MYDHTPTFADLCSAIADGSIEATLDGTTYQVSLYELRRYFNRSGSLPVLPTSASQTSLAVDGSGSWSANMHSFVA